MKKNTLWLAGLAFLALVVLAGIFLFSPNLPGRGEPPASAATPRDTDKPQAALETFGPSSTAIVSAPTEAVKAPLSAVTAAAPSFNGQRAYQDVEMQMSFGPRTPGSPAHDQVVEWIQKELAASGWTVELQETTRMGHSIRNILAKRGTENAGSKPWILLGAHFDSRLKADQDPDPNRREEPVPAANDGASGVAVLLELARVLPKDLNQQVWLAFFDAEDQGELPGWDWLLGSRVVAESLTGKPDAVIVVDMIGDADLNVYEERNSDPGLTKEIWSTAEKLGYQEAIIPEPRWSMLDDHTPFLEKGIRAVDMIDFDYPHWHTTADTADKVSADSLKIIGETLLQWAVQRHQY